MTTAGVRKRWVPSGRSLGIVAVVLAVLAGGGYLAKPLWQPWWFAATLCGGHLSGGDLAELLPGKQLQAGRDNFEDGAGHLRCAVNEDDHTFVLAADAQTDPADVRRAMAMEFTVPYKPEYVFPRNVPGFYGQFGPVIIQECPKLGRDERGYQHHLVTNVLTLGVERDASAASLRIAVSLANGAAERLGCGSAPLPRPDRVTPPRTLPVSQLAGTMCDWLTRTALPKSPSGAGWQVEAPTDERAPITNCSLLDPRTGKPFVDLTGWYGGWAEKSFEDLLESNVEIPEQLSARHALMSERLGRAKARCQGDPANFLVSLENAGGSAPAPPTAAQLRTLLNAFAADQAARRGCTDVELPGPKVHKKPDLRQRSAARTPPPCGAGSRCGAAGRAAPRRRCRWPAAR